MPIEAFTVARLLRKQSFGLSFEHYYNMPVNNKLKEKKMFNKYFGSTLIPEVSHTGLQEPGKKKYSKWTEFQ